MTEEEDLAWRNFETSMSNLMDSLKELHAKIQEIRNYFENNPTISLKEVCLVCTYSFGSQNSCSLTKCPLIERRVNLENL